MTARLLHPLSPCGRTIYVRMVGLASRRGPQAIPAPAPSEEQLDVLGTSANLLIGRMWASVAALGKGPSGRGSMHRRIERRSTQRALRDLEAQRLVVPYASGARGTRAYLVFATPIDEAKYQALLALRGGIDGKGGEL